MNTVKFLTIKLSFVFFVFLTSCGLDPGSFQPDAKVFGAIRDSLDNSLVEQDLIEGSSIELLEKGYTTPYFWSIKENGEYRYNFAFSNSYTLDFRNCNFFPHTINDVTIKPGDNEMDFSVVPYIRVKLDSMVYVRDSTWNAVTSKYDQINKVTATFKLDAGRPYVKVSFIQLFAFSDIHVGEPLKFIIIGGGNFQMLDTFIDPNHTYTLSIDISKNIRQGRFYKGGDYYFRVGAQATFDASIVADFGTIRYNYAPYKKIKLADY